MSRFTLGGFPQRSNFSVRNGRSLRGMAEDTPALAGMGLVPQWPWDLCVKSQHHCQFPGLAGTCWSSRRYRLQTTTPLLAPNQSTVLVLRAWRAQPDASEHVLWDPAACKV